MRNLHAVFRLKKGANQGTDAFMDRDRTDQRITIVPNRNALPKLRAAAPLETFAPIRLRLVQYTVQETTFVLGTTLLDGKRVSIPALADLYPARWGIEELYKISKQRMVIEEFHRRSERGVKQERYAHAVLITLTRLFSNQAEDHIHEGLPPGKSPRQVNFKHSLITVARNIEGRLLQQAAVLNETVTRIVRTLAACHQKVRPNRSVERRSRKPVGKWSGRPPAKAATTG